MASTTIQIRIDEKEKKITKKVFEDLGLDISSATKLFYKKAVATRSIPFEVRTENGFTPAQETEMLKDLAWAKKHGKKFDNMKDFMKDLNS
ncbi:MAG: type II toxin-antitoxin system RelB/DinJ family antitoxin [Candidatus Paceibacterota bacterium]